MPSIVCTHLSFSWPDDNPVFTDLSFTAGAGRTGLVAPNGAGKSRLLRLIAGDLSPTGGALNALAAGDAREELFTAIGDDWDIEERTRAQLDRLGLGHVALDRSLRSLSGGEVVALGLARELLRGRGSAAGRAHQQPGHRRPAPALPGAR